MNIRDLLTKRNAAPVIETVAIKGLGEVRVRRVTAGQAISFDTALDAVAATIVDENNALLFADRAAVDAADWALVKLLIDAYHKVNDINVEEALKN